VLELSQEWGGDEYYGNQGMRGAGPQNSFSEVVVIHNFKELFAFYSIFL